MKGRRPLNAGDEDKSNDKHSVRKNAGAFENHIGSGVGLS
jgi:hypothetical protein